jgi:hypothetical protein
MQNRHVFSRHVLGLGSLLLACSGCTDEGSASDQSSALSAPGDPALCTDAGGDVSPPVLSARPQLQLWPPNHKFHSIRVEDCFSVSDCQGGVQAEFVWASSDEPIDSIGDGHHAPDIQVESCGAIALRSERQGPKNGRVYKLGVRAVDPAGNASEAICTVIVDHDQRGVLGADSGEAYRVTFDGKNGLPLCDGDNPPPPNPPVQQPPVQQPPVQNPPVQQPPVQNPPVQEPPVQEPPVQQPPSDGPTPF